MLWIKRMDDVYFRRKSYLMKKKNPIQDRPDIQKIKSIICLWEGMLKDYNRYHKMDKSKHWNLMANELRQCIKELKFAFGLF